MDDPASGHGEEVDVHQYDLIALRDDGVLAYLYVTAPAEHFDEDIARTIVESLDLR